MLPHFCFKLQAYGEYPYPSLQPKTFETMNGAVLHQDMFFEKSYELCYRRHILPELQTLLIHFP